MYFSKIVLREDAHLSRNFWLVFRDTYTLHRSIWKVFADHEDRKRDFLYRLDQGGKRPFIYTVSQRKPDINSGLWHIETKKYEPQIRSGMRLSFMLRVNPILTKRDKKGKQHRHDIVMDAKTRLNDSDGNKNNRKSLAVLAQEEGSLWLSKRAEKHGFAIDQDIHNNYSCQLRVDGYQQHHFSKGKGSKIIKFSTLDFTGVLIVIDNERFIETLYKGIGPAKGFGCGMMIVKRT
jgi:CRISPR system Cascade subunit CasE